MRNGPLPVNTKSFPWEYHPGILDTLHPTIIAGNAIVRGSRVCIAHEHAPRMLGWSKTFACIMDEHGNVQNVFKRALVRPMLKTFRLVWSPEGKTIATVQAIDASKAKRMAPMPYRKFLGEIYVEEINA